MGDFEIKPLTPATWEAFAALAQKHNGVWGGCWCTYFHPDFPERQQQRPDDNRDLKHRLVEEGKAHAALIFDGEVAVGWCEYGTPEELPSIYHRRSTRRSRTWCPTTGSPASSSTATTAVRASLRPRSAGRWTSSRGPGAAWSRATRGTPRARRSRRRSSTNGTRRPVREGGVRVCAQHGQVRLRHAYHGRARLTGRAGVRPTESLQQMADPPHGA